MGAPLDYVLAAMAGLFLYAGALHLLSEREPANRLFGLLCGFAAGYCIANLVALHATTATGLVAGIRWRAAFVILLYLTLLWFMRSLSHAISLTVAGSVTAAYAILLIANTLLPFGISFIGLPEAPDVAAVDAAGVFDNVPFWLPILRLTHIAMLGICLHACWKGFRSDQRTEARAIGTVLAAVMVMMILATFEEVLFPPGFISIRTLTEALHIGLALTISLLLRRRIAVHNGHLRALVDHVPAYVFMKDFAGRYIFVNRYWLDQFGRTPESSLGKTDLDLFPEAVAAVYRQNDRRVLATGQLLEFEEASSPITHEARIYSSLKFPVRGSNGQPQLLGGISTDVTEFARLQDALQLSESRLKQALTAARIAIWEWDLPTGVITWSENAPVVLDRPAAGMPVHIDAAMEIIHVSDRSEVAARIEAARLRHDSNYVAEFRIAATSGDLIWLEARGNFERNPAGEPVCMRGTITDVSQRKRAVEIQLESQERYRQLAAATFEGIAISENGIILDSNEQLVEMFGYTREAVLGQPLAIGIAPESMDRAREMIATGGEGPYEVTALRRDGSRFDVEVRARMFTAGERRLRISAFRDVTLRKQAEASLRLAQASEIRIREEFAQHLLAAQEQERKRLANDLHDSLGQSLSLIRNRATLALEADASAARTHLRSIVDLTITSIAELRTLVHSLRPVHIEQLGLTQSLKSLLDQAAQSTTIRLDIHLEDVDDLFSGEQSTHIYRIVQEALANLVRHSGAGSGWLSLERDIRCVRLRIADDGKGFDVDKPAAKGLGLTSIIERVHMLGGHFQLKSAPGDGTRMVIEFPLTDVPTAFPA